MSSIKVILTGWYRRLFKVQSEMAKERLAICKPCTYNVFGQCAICYCNLKAMAEIEEEKCKHPDANKWGKVSSLGPFVSGYKEIKGPTEASPL